MGSGCDETGSSRADVGRPHRQAGSCRYLVGHIHQESRYGLEQGLGASIAGFGLAHQGAGDGSGGCAMGSEVDGDESEFDDLRRFFATRYIRIFCDFCTDCLWDIDGMEQSIITFPVTPDLRVRMICWRERYHDLEDKYENYVYSDDPAIPDDVRIEQKQDWEDFAAEGLAIARAVKAQLPDWTVVYLDETKVGSSVRHGPDREPYEFEIGADGSTIPLQPRSI